MIYSYNRCLLSLRSNIQLFFRSRMSSKVGQLVSFSSANALGDARGVVIGDPKKHPRGLIVIHEWWGMNEQIQEEGAQIASEGGFTVLVPDMYRGKVAKDREEAGHYMNGLDWDGAVLDLSAGAKYLISLGCSRVGVTGFCMGGALSFVAALRCPEISASAPFYGIPSPDFGDLTKIRIPVQSHFGEKDEVVGFSSPADFSALKERLAAAGVQHEMFVYPAGHGFTNVKNPNYSADATRLALGRVYEFMKKNLASSKV